MGDLGDLWNATKDTVSIFGSGQSVNMGNRAFACPNGLHPGDLDWSRGAHMQLEADTLEWTNKAREWFGLSTGSKIHFGAIWDYGGTSRQHPGLYVAEAYLYAVLDFSSAGTDFTVTGGFGDPLPLGNSAELPCWIRIDKTQFHMHAGTWQYDGRIRGNGSGYFREV